LHACVEDCPEARVVEEIPEAPAGRSGISPGVLIMRTEYWLVAGLQRRFRRNN